MKVLNWVNRRFLHGSIQGEKGIQRNGKSKADIEMHGLLENKGHAAVDVLNGWKEGILSIGTLAIGPLEATITAKFELVDKQVDRYENEDDLYNDEETNNYVNVIDDELEDDSESMPLMKMALFSHELEKMDVVGDNDIDGIANPCKEITKEQVEDVVIVDDDSKIVNNNDVCEVSNDEKECQIKRRVTLAELFLEDSVKLGTKVLPNYVAHNKEDCFVKGKSCSHKMKPISHTKNGLSKAKKLLKEELRPIKKLNQLMKRMMKKKIHPEMVEGGKMEDMDMEKKPSKAKDIPTHELDLDAAAYESASLLHLQGCAI